MALRVVSVTGDAAFEGEAEGEDEDEDEDVKEKEEASRSAVRGLILSCLLPAATAVRTRSTVDDSLPTGFGAMARSTGRSREETAAFLCTCPSLVLRMSSLTLEADAGRWRGFGWRSNHSAALSLRAPPVGRWTQSWRGLVILSARRRWISRSRVFRGS
jgi:hypothetical protein